MITLLEFLQKKHIEDQSELEIIDLGLPSGTLWCSRNIGADKPEDYGDFFAWGETEPKKEFSAYNYKFYISDMNYSKYNNKDHKIIIDDIDDAANAILGSKYQIPSLNQINELVNNCRINKKDKYCIFTSKINKKEIIFPLSGFKTDKHYYLGTKCFIKSNESIFSHSFRAYRIERKHEWGNGWGNMRRLTGLPIRAVTFK